MSNKIDTFSSLLIALEDKSAVEVKKSFARLLGLYLNPAFGSIAKRDFEVAFFGELQALGLIEIEPDLYDVLTQLRVTRAKARSLLYESNLRRLASGKELNDKLIAELSNPRLFPDGEKVALEFSNPLLQDHLRKKLKDLGHLSDGSFAPELVRLTADAYVDLVTQLLGAEDQKLLERALVERGLKDEGGLKSMLKAALKHYASQFMGSEAASMAINKSGRVLSELFEFMKK